MTKFTTYSRNALTPIFHICNMQIVTFQPEITTNIPISQNFHADSGHWFFRNIDYSMIFLILLGQKNSRSRSFALIFFKFTDRLKWIIWKILAKNLKFKINPITKNTYITKLTALFIPNRLMKNKRIFYRLQRADEGGLGKFGSLVFNTKQI